MKIRHLPLKVLENEKTKIKVMANFCFVKVCFLTQEQLFSSFRAEEGEEPQETS